MSTREEMIAHGRTEAEVAAELGADSLAYLSLDGRLRGDPRARATTHCDACFSGEYPLAGTAAAQARTRSSTRSRSCAAERGHGSPATPCDDFAANLRSAPDARPEPAVWSPVRVARRRTTSPSRASGPPPPEPVARADASPTAALRELFGFEAFRPGQREAVEAAPGGPRRAGGDAHRLGQVALLPAAGADADGPDARRLAAGLADAGPGGGAASASRPAASRSSTPSRTRATNRRAVERAVAGHVRLLYVAPERFASPGLPGAHPRRREIGLFVVDEAHCVSQWGHDFRPDYFRLADAARWLGAEAIVASTATATPQVAADIVARLGLRDPVHVATGFDRPNLSFAVVPCANKEAVHRADRRRARASRARCRRSSTRARARSATGCRDRLGRELGVEVIAYHAGPAARRARRGAAALHGGRGAGRRRHQRVRDGRRQGRRADGLPRVACPSSIEAYYQEAGRAGRDGAARPLPAVRHGRATRACTSSSSSARRSARTQLKAVARAIVRSRRAGRRRRATTCTLDELARCASGDEEAVRAIVGHLARAGVIQPAPSAPDRVAGRLVGAWDARALARCRTAAQEGTRVALAPVPLGLGVGRGRRSAAARASCATSATARRPRPPGRAATSAIPSLVPRRRSRAPRAAAPARASSPSGRSPPATSATSTRRSSTSWRAAQPEVGRTRAVEILRGGRSKVVAKYSYDGLPHYGAFGAPARRRRARARRRAARARARCARPAGASRSWRSRELGRRPRLGRRHEPAGDPRPRPRARRRRGRRRRLRQAGRAGARARARRPACATRGLRARRVRRPRGARRSRWPRWLREPRRRARRARGLHAAAQRRRSSPRFPRRRDQRAPGAAARVPGHPRGRAGARLRREGVRRHRPLRRRGRRHRADHPPARGRAARTPRTPAEVRDALRPLEHELLCEAVALIARGAVRLDPTIRAACW